MHRTSHDGQASAQSSFSSSATVAWHLFKSPHSSSPPVPCPQQPACPLPLASRRRAEEVVSRMPEPTVNRCNWQVPYASCRHVGGGRGSSGCASAPLERERGYGGGASGGRPPSTPGLNRLDVSICLPPPSFFGRRPMISYLLFSRRRAPRRAGGPTDPLKNK